MNTEVDPVEQTDHRKEHVSIEAIGHVGLQNLGNTCFMNSGLQVLLSSKHLVRAVLQSSVAEKGVGRGPGPGICMLMAFQDLIAASTSQKLGIYKPTQMKNAAARLNRAFAGYGQQDSFELIQTVLDGLEKETNSAKKVQYTVLDTVGKSYTEVRAAFRELHDLTYNSPITRVVCTELAKCVTCKACQAQSFSFSYCQTLLLDLPPKGDKSNTNLSLAELIQDSTKAYSVDNYHCEKCGRQGSVTVREWISEPAQCLIIQLKRFRNSGSSVLSRIWSYSKNNVSVQYSSVLELAPGPYDHSSAAEKNGDSHDGTPASTQTYRYQYRGASLHSGSLGGGHYTALCYGCDDNFYSCNDSRVEITREPHIDPCAYVLLFDRIN